MLEGFGTYDYLLLGVLSFFLLFALFIGINKMIKLIIGNYVLVGICLAIRNLIYIVINLLEKVMTEPDQIQTLLQNSRSTITFIIYFFLIVLIFIKSKISIGNFNNVFKKFLFSIIFAPLTVMSIASTLVVVRRGNEFFDTVKIEGYSQYFTNDYVKLAVSWLPLWFILPGLFMIIFSLDFNFPRITLKKKKNKDSKDILASLNEDLPQSGGGAG